MPLMALPWKPLETLGAEENIPQGASCPQLLPVPLTADQTRQREESPQPPGCSASECPETETENHCLTPLKLSAKTNISSFKLLN